MPILRVIFEGSETKIRFTQGCSIRKILNTGGIRIRTACGGIGTCGLCLIHIKKGSVNYVSNSEKIQLSDRKLKKGIRFACQTIPENDLDIIVKYPVLKSNWGNLVPDEYTPEVFPHAIPGSIKIGLSYGVAVDLGTSNIRISIWDLKKKGRLAGRTGLNPQFYFGADLLTRLVTASESKKQALAIRQMANDAISEAILDISTEKSLNIDRIEKIKIVGNTAMLALLTGKNYNLLLHPENWTREIDYQPDETGSYPLYWGLDQKTNVEFVPSFAGFVGSDLLAGVLATELIKSSTPSLLIDFGTNSEIALWDGVQLWVTAAAGGPAFEGSGISCGMPAVQGAIYGIKMKGPSIVDHYNVIGNGNAKGLCGSGLVDIIKSLLNVGVLKKNGNFVDKFKYDGFSILKGDRDIILTKQDVDLFQRAKAAIGAGVKFLIKKAGMQVQDIQYLYVCGAFGRFLNIKNAQDIGLLPPVKIQNIELCGNTALSGCEYLLFSNDTTEIIDSIKKRSQILNLSNNSDFENMFIENLYLQPITSVG